MSHLSFHLGSSSSGSDRRKHQACHVEENIEVIHLVNQYFKRAVGYCTSRLVDKSKKYEQLVSK